jgi:hypothetical protein
MRMCPDCGNEFSSNGSYRVHKYRFHRDKPIANQVAKQAPSEPESVVKPLEKYVTLVSSPKPQAPEPEPVSRASSSSASSGGSAGALILGGIILGLGALALKKWLDERDRNR